MNNDEHIDDCWNRIGIWRQDGQPCPLLEQFIHCRNCDTFIETGLKLLDRDLPDSTIKENTAIYRNNEQQYDTQTISCLIFRLGKEWHAIKTSILNEIYETTEIHSIPHNKKASLEGLACINGEMEICVSLTTLITGGISTHHDRKIKSRIILVKLDSGNYAFKACEVLGIYPIDENILEQPPASVANAKDKITESVFTFDNKSIGLISKNYLDLLFVEATS